MKLNSILSIFAVLILQFSASAQIKTEKSLLKGADAKVATFASSSTSVNFSIEDSQTLLAMGVTEGLLYCTTAESGETEYYEFKERGDILSSVLIEQPNKYQKHNCEEQMDDEELEGSGFTIVINDHQVIEISNAEYIATDDPGILIIQAEIEAVLK